MKTNSVTFNNTLYSPSKCICIGRNYHGHIKEMGSKKTDSVVVFNKPNSAIMTQLHCQHGDERLHYETELCFLMINNKPAAVGLGLDLTKRRLQRALKADGLPWEKSKSFNGSALFSPFVRAPECIDSLGFSLHVDGQLRQQALVKDMIFSPQDIFEDVLAFQSIYSGDIVMSGTPEGVGEVEEGKEYKVTLFSGTKKLLGHSWQALA